MHTGAYVLLFAGALAGGFVSGLAGFGTALMALGLWLHVLPPTAAVSLVLICSVVGQTATLPSNDGGRIPSSARWISRPFLMFR